MIQQEVGDWHARRFPPATALELIAKATEELGELAAAVNCGRGDVGEEAADVAICVMALLERFYPGRELLIEIKKKLAILNDPNSGHRSAIRDTECQRSFERVGHNSIRTRYSCGVDLVFGLVDDPEKIPGRLHPHVPPFGDPEGVR